MSRGKHDPSARPEAGNGGRRRFCKPELLQQRVTDQEESEEEAPGTNLKSFLDLSITQESVHEGLLDAKLCHRPYARQIYRCRL